VLQRRIPLGYMAQRWWDTPPISTIRASAFKTSLLDGASKPPRTTFGAFGPGSCDVACTLRLSRNLQCVPFVAATDSARSAAHFNGDLADTGRSGPDIAKPVSPKIGKPKRSAASTMSRVCPLSGKEGTPHMLTSETAPTKTGVPFTKCRKLGKGTSQTGASTTNDIIITVRLIGRRDRSHPSSRINGWPGGSLYPQSKRQTDARCNKTSATLVFRPNQAGTPGCGWMPLALDERYRFSKMPPTCSPFSAPGIH
jgi:hypothetical protein